jgi:hypothetical protein
MRTLIQVCHRALDKADDTAQDFLFLHLEWLFIAIWVTCPSLGETLGYRVEQDKVCLCQKLTLHGGRDAVTQ